MDGIKIKCTSFWQILLGSCQIAVACLSLQAVFLEGFSPHMEKPHQIPSVAARYRLIDLGSIDASLEDLSKFSGLPNASPAINNAGEVIGNSRSGGVFIRPNLRTYNPKIKGARIEFRALNNQGDLLVAINRGKLGMDWVIWPKNLRGQERSIPIDPVEVQGADLLFNTINDSLWVAGETHPDGRYRPILWTPDQGVYRVGFFNGLDIKGIIRQINDNGAVLGQFMGNIEHPPFIWDPIHGLLVLDKYRSYFKSEPQGRIEFSDLVMTNQYVVYGTYWINDQLKDIKPTLETPHGSFVWLPLKKQFFLTDREGMRLAQVNSANELVGSLKGQAAILQPGLKPVFLKDLTYVEDLEGWTLAEATGINDIGQIVGFGTRNGQTHLFRADPLP